MTRYRCTRQAIALVNATAGLAKSIWFVGDILGCEHCTSRCMLIELVILHDKSVLSIKVAQSLTHSKIDPRLR